MKNTLILTYLLVCISKAFSINYYVCSSKGNDNYSGTSTELPFKTLQKSANAVQPGDTVFIMNGTYTNSDNEVGFFQSQILFMMHSGKPNAWITFQALEGHQPILIIQKAFGIRVVSTDTFHKDGVLSYIRIKNLKIVGNTNQIPFCEALKQPRSCFNPEGEINWNYNGSGISIGSEDSYADKGKVTHHIEVINCDVSDCASAGISAYRSDYVTIEQCKVYNNCWKSSFGSSGIHVYNPRSSIVKENVPFHFIIKRNEIYNNRNEVPFYSGKKCHGFTDGNGIIIDDSKNLQSNKENYAGNFLIENNVIYENGGSGISIFQSERVTIRNNTTYKNCQLTPDNKKRAELLLIAAYETKIYNNSMYASDNQSGYYKGSKCKKTDYGINLIFNAKKNTRSKKTIKKDPMYVLTNNSNKTTISCNEASTPLSLIVIPNSLIKDLRLQPNSPARAIASPIESANEDFFGVPIIKNQGLNLGAFQ